MDCSEELMTEETKILASDKLEEMRLGDEMSIPGVDDVTMEEPPWLDKEKFYRAREIHRKHFVSINFSHFCGLLLSFYFSKNVITLRSTGLSETMRSLYHRYLATIQHIQSWYEGDVWDIEDPARKSLITVKTMHKRVANKMAKLNDGTVYISQWDMTLTQWAFIGPILLFPSQLGLHGCSVEDFEALIYFWRCIGYLLGVQDQNNLCRGSYKDVFSSCHTLLMEEYRVKVMKADDISVTMCREVATALEKLNRSHTWGTLALYIHSMLKIPCPVATTLMDWISFWNTRFVLLYAIRLAPIRFFLNFILRIRLDRAFHASGLEQARDGNIVARVSAG